MSGYWLQTIVFDRAFFLRVPSSVYLLTLARMKAYFPVSSSACNEEEDVSCVEIRMSRRNKYIKLCSRWSNYFLRCASIFLESFIILHKWRKSVLKKDCFIGEKKRTCEDISSVRYSRHVQPRRAALRITMASLLNIRVRRRWCRVIGVPYSLLELPGHRYLL